MGITDYPLDVWNVDDGLPQASVQAMVQDSQGYVWLGTQEGLVRFDGVRFVVYDHTTEPGLVSDDVRALAIGPEGRLWIGTRSGLAVRGPAGVESVGSEMAVVNTLHVTADGVWVGSDNGVALIDDSGRLAPIAGSPTVRVRALTHDHEGRLWIGTSGAGAVVLEGSRSWSLGSADGLPDDEVLALECDRSGRVWIGTRTRLSCWQQGQLTHFGAADGLGHDTVWTVFEDRGGRLWIGTSSGLLRLDGERFSRLSTDDGLSHKIVWSLLEDREGSLWVGTSSGGLNRLRDGKFVVIDRRAGLTTEFVWSILEDDDGVIWLGTDGGGLARVDGRQVSHLTTADGLIDNEVLALHQDRDGKLWVGTRLGLNLIVDGIVSTVDGFADEVVRAVLVDQRGVLWVATTKGLVRQHGDLRQLIDAKQGLAGNQVRCLVAGGPGVLWAGSSDGGLTRIEDRDGQLKFNILRCSDGLASDTVFDITVTRDGSLFVGTDSGISWIRDGVPVSFTHADGLYDDKVFRILEDGLGSLWMSSNKGVFSIRRDELTEVADGDADRFHSTVYGRRDGMGSRECNGGVQPAGTVARDGRLWFPTVAGASVIDPANIRTNQVAPNVVIESLAADGDLLEPSQPFCPAGVRRVELFFTALTLVAPDSVRFRYRLDPFDDDWVKAEGQRSATYTHLSPGQYRFRVLAANNDGVWSAEEASFDLFVRPFFYQTAWFLVLVLVAFIGCGWLVWTARVRQLRTRYTAILSERQRMAREIHDTIAQGLTGAAIHLNGIEDAVEHDPSAVTRHVEQARSMVAAAMADTRRSVWNLRSGLIEGCDLGESLARIGDQLTSATAIHLVADVNCHRRVLHPHTAAELLRVGQEVMTNAVRHSGCENLEVRLTFSNGRVHLAVIDDGIGFDPDTTTGFGLTGVRERVRALHGMLKLSSSPAGTTVEVSTPAIRGGAHS